MRLRGEFVDQSSQRPTENPALDLLPDLARAVGRKVLPVTPERPSGMSHVLCSSRRPVGCSPFDSGHAEDQARFMSELFDIDGLPGRLPAAWRYR